MDDLILIAAVKDKIVNLDSIVLYVPALCYIDSRERHPRVSILATAQPCQDASLTAKSTA